MPDWQPLAPKVHDPDRAERLLTLEFGSRDDFDNPKLEYRRLFSELLGTFFLVLVAAGGGILHAKGQISLAAAVVAPGLMVLAIILFMGAVSGAHLKPAVSLAFAARGDFPWRRVPGYIIVQLLGATLACLFLLAVSGNIEHLGATLPGPGYHDWQAFLMEIASTAGLLSVILGTASAAQNVGAIGALGVSGYIALAGLWAAPVSGTSMNPARSFGPALVSGDWTADWVYVARPLIGAAIAVGCAIILRGRGGDPIFHAAGSGVLTAGRLEQRAKLAQEIDEGKVVPPGLAPTDTNADPQPGTTRTSCPSSPTRPRPSSTMRSSAARPRYRVARPTSSPSYRWRRLRSSPPPPAPRMRTGRSTTPQLLNTSVVNVSLGARTPLPPSRWGRRACVRGSPGT